nr:hypothetical protein [Tanacetum cinerariifolium]
MDIEVEKDDLNQKFLTSLAPEWLMHTIVWRNRNDLDTVSLDDLYNHLKVYEAEVQKKSNSNSQNMAFISSSKHSSGDEDDKFWKRTGKKISIQGSDVAGFDKSKDECFNCHKMGHFARECRAPRSPERGRKENYRQGSKAEQKTPKALMAIDGIKKDGLDGKLAGLLKASKNHDNLIESQRKRVQSETTSQDTASAYIASQSSGSRIKFEDINQINEDDMEEMDIKWSMALLSMRADKFWKRTGKKISIHGSDSTQKSRKRKEKNYRQGSKAEQKTPKALMAIDGVGWDWSYMENKGEDHALVADAEAPIEFALMANTESKVFDNSLCSKEYKKNNDSLNNKIKDLTDELFEANNYNYHYKLAVAQLEGRLVEYKEREVKYIEKIRTLELYKESNLKSIESLSKKLDTLKLKKDGLDGKLAGLLKASKNLDNLIESQRSDKFKDGVGYNAVPPPAVDLYLSPKKDLSWTGLPEFVDDTVTDYSRPSPTVASTSAEGQDKNSTTSEDVASPNTPKPFVKFVKPKDSQSESKTNKQETPKKPQVKYAKQYRHSNKKPNVKGNQRNWNNLKSYQLGPEFVLKKKACFSCGNFSHLANDCRKRVQKETTRRNFPTANRKFPTASRKFPTGSIKIHTADMGRKGKAGSSQNNIDDKGYWDSGCSRHMIGNISYLSDFEPFDGGYVSFRQGGCKITGKGTIKNGLRMRLVTFLRSSLLK